MWTRADLPPQSSPPTNLQITPDKGYNLGMAQPNTKTTVVWQVADGGLRKWVQRPLHNCKKNFRWAEGGMWWGDCQGREIELRRLTIDPQLGFFASEQEALDCLEKRLVGRLEQVKAQTWEKFLVQYGDQGTGTRWSYDHRTEPLLNAIASIKERQAVLAVTMSSDQERLDE
jgi:hypothetical protein